MQITTSSGSSASPFPPGFQFYPFRFLLGVIGFIGILVTFFALLFGFISIPTNSVGVKLRFGAYHSTEGPGLAYAIPYVDEILIVPTQRLLKLEFGFTTPGASNRFQGDEQAADTETMITGDLNTALVPWVVQYRITDPKQYTSARANRSRLCAISPKV